MALSPGESKLYAALKSTAETLGFISMLKYLNWELQGGIYGDANVALGIINNTVLGKTRHINTCLLWTQQTATEKRFEFHKALGKNNVADLYTNNLDVNTSDAHVKILNYKFEDGRATEAPKLHELSRAWAQCVAQSEMEEWKRLKFIIGHREIFYTSGHEKEINVVTNDKRGRLTVQDHGCSGGTRGG